MIFIYIACKFYKISNVVSCETLILNYNGEFNLGTCLFFKKITYSCYDFLNLILYMFNVGGWD